MDMEQFKAQLKELAGKDGEKAWMLVENWYTSEGRARRVSLHDLHDLSSAIAKELVATRQVCAEMAVAWQVKLCADDDWTCESCTECNQLRYAIIGNGHG